MHRIMLLGFFSLCFSGCFGSFGGDRGVETRSGANFVDRMQLCENNVCTDDPEAIDRKIDQLYRKHHGHGQKVVYAVTGSVVAGVTCPICGQGLLTNAYTQYWPFNPDDDGDNTPHTEDYGSCNNRSCDAYNSHKYLPGSRRPAPQAAIPGTRTVNGRVRVVLPDAFSESGFIQPGFIPLPLQTGVPAFNPNVAPVFPPGMVPAL